ncbi:MAG: hypothetical protein ACE5SW_02970 [Nitrososphaeraceae archaeon]
MYKEIKKKKFLDSDGRNEILAIYEGDFVRFYRMEGDKMLDEDVLIEGDFRIMTREEGWKEIL